MDISSESDAQMLGLQVVDNDSSHNISFEGGAFLGAKRLHLDSESSSANEDCNFIGYMMDKRIKLKNTILEHESSAELKQETGCRELAEDNGMILRNSTSEELASVSGDLAFTAVDETPVWKDEESCVLIHHMDIKEPLSALKKSLELTHAISLDGYEFYLQDTTHLAGHKNLVEQCVQGCGTVQINLQLKIDNDGTKKINIQDVLKPSDSYLLATGNPAFGLDVAEDPDGNQADATGEEPGTDSDKNLIRWVIDKNFKRNQHRFNVPLDPMEWEVLHVRHWLLWAVKQFNLTGIKLADWNISGKELCNLTLEDFKKRVPYDPVDIFWSHLELLRRCKIVAVMENPEEVLPQPAAETPKTKSSELDKNIMGGREKKTKTNVKNAMLVDAEGAPVQTSGLRVISGNNGQVQLWQFLLDLLTDKNHRECIQWLGAEGEFKLIEPDRVAYLWGMRKNKPSMTYEKLSRALRYYYDGDMIAKVHGKRFVYKFVCDLKQLLGYSAFDLNRLVIEAEMRALNAANDPLQYSIFGRRDFPTL